MSSLTVYILKHIHLRPRSLDAGTKLPVDNHYGINCSHDYPQIISG